ncbi:MAG: DUF1294 domain-containing protein [Methylococcaceae bacterium]|nr:DUF1294 domain-containing protein [Methylococcaceae bacterium]
MTTQQKGILVLWNDDKGFGFVRPEGGDKDFFVHISAIKNYHKGLSRRPTTGDTVRFQPDSNAPDGGQRRISHAIVEELEAAGATDAAPASAAPSGTAFSRIPGLLIKLLAILPVLFSLDVVLRYHNPMPLAAYVFMTPLTIMYYAEDKRRALQHLWRIPNVYMHCFEILGGWPGALLAQNAYRHKLKRGTYQNGFWAIVALHGIAWAVYFYFQSDLGG